MSNLSLNLAEGVLDMVRATDTGVTQSDVCPRVYLGAPLSLDEMVLV